MPDLDTDLHLRMLHSSPVRRSLPSRILRAVKREIFSDAIYGLEWGDTEIVEPLRFVKDRYLMPYVNAEHVAVEIGPGGGRWTRHLLGFKRIYAVDYHSELLDELRKNFRASNIELVQNNGTDFPGVPRGSVDYLFSFGVFVHLDKDIIEAYLENMQGILKPKANVVIQYSDKNKIMAQLLDGFSDNTPEKMRAMVIRAGYKVLEEDLTTMWHSSVVRFTKSE